MNKKLKLRIVKFENALLMKVLKMSDFDCSEHVRHGRTDFANDCVYLRNEPDIGIARFCNNIERDEYLKKMLGWITDEQFDGKVKGVMKIGEMCEVSDDGKQWSKRLYVGKIESEVKKEKPFLSQDQLYRDRLVCWRYARPIKSPLTVEGENYTWESEVRW